LQPTTRLHRIEEELLRQQRHLAHAISGGWASDGELPRILRRELELQLESADERLRAVAAESGAARNRIADLEADLAQTRVRLSAAESALDSLQRSPVGALAEEVARLQSLVEGGRMAVKCVFCRFNPGRPLAVRWQ
jgi:chromosome segregation ATPase